MLQNCWEVTNFAVEKSFFTGELNMVLIFLCFFYYFKAIKQHGDFSYFIIFEIGGTVKVVMV